MRLSGKRLLLLAADGVDLDDYETLRKAFELEDAVIFVTAPSKYEAVETILEGKRCDDLQIDIPIEAIDPQQFEGVIIPGGQDSVDSLRRNREALNLIRAFHEQSKVILASSQAGELLRNSGVLSRQIMVRENESVYDFVNHAVNVLLEPPFRLYTGYRSTI